MIDNPARNGIMDIFDSLCTDLEWNGIKKDLAREFLKSSLKKSTEKQAEYYLRRLHKISSDVICTIEIQSKR